MPGYNSIPLNANEPYQRIPLDRPSTHTILVHDSVIVGCGYWFEAVCSTNASVKTSVSIMANVPWNMTEAVRKGWPVINEEDLWSPCPDLPDFTLTSGVIYRKVVTECIQPYRRIKFTVTPSIPSDANAKRLGYAALRIEMFII